MAKGFKMPKNTGNKGMMQQIQKLQEQLQATQEQLAQQTVTASAGGGAVKITMTGDQRCTSVEIDAELLKETDVEMLQDLFLAATNSALDQSRQLATDKLGPLTGGLPF